MFRCNIKLFIFPIPHKVDGGVIWLLWLVKTTTHSFNKRNDSLIFNFWLVIVVCPSIFLVRSRPVYVEIMIPLLKNDK
eukprot:UN15977